MEFYFQDQLRWSLGFDNPNKAAALIASLLPLVWLFASGSTRFKRVALNWTGVCIVSVMICGGWWLLFKTYSRGGIVAGAVAFTYIAFCSRKTLLRYWIPISGSVLGVTVLFITTHAAHRTVGWIGAHEGSVENRFTLWKGGLEMLAENPQGVGSGNSGEIYMQWYQPLDATEHYRTLVNSYLTFATEQGVCIFAAVVFIAAFFWRATAPQGAAAFERDLVIGLRAVLVAFATAGFFSTTMEEWTLWIVPTLSMLALVAMALWKREWHRWGISLAQAAVIAITICGCVYGAGLFMVRKESLRISIRGGKTQEITIEPRHDAGGAIADCLCLPLDNEVTGHDYGKLLRRLATGAHLRVHLASQDRDQPGWIIFASGEGAYRLAKMKDKDLVLLSPAKNTDADAVAILQSAKSAKLFLPGFDEDGRVEFWKDAAEKALRPEAITIQILDGVGTESEWAWDKVVTGF